MTKKLTLAMTAGLVLAFLGTAVSHAAPTASSVQRPDWSQAVNGG
jgi:hypothetical protein